MTCHYICIYRHLIDRYAGYKRTCEHVYFLEFPSCTFSKKSRLLLSDFANKILMSLAIIHKTQRPTAQTEPSGTSTQRPQQQQQQQQRVPYPAR